MSPNVVVVVVDALRSDRVGAMGGRDVTPNLDEMAAESVTFTNAFSTANATDVAVTSLQTGRYPLSHGVVNHGSRVTDGEKRSVERVTQLPEALSDEGYRTAAFGRSMGRWHRNGFDVYPGGEPGQNGIVSKSHISSALSTVHPYIRDLAAASYDRTVGRLQAERMEGEQTPDPVVRNFAEFVAKQEPFYAFVHLMDTHVPYDADPELVASYLERFDYDVEPFDTHLQTVPESFHERVAAGEYPEIADRYYFSDGEPSSAVIDAHYDAAATKADRRVGCLLDVLKARELLDETLVCVLSDHGESLTEHGIYYDHHGLYDVSVRVPLIIRPPGGNRGSVDGFVQITDIAPTVASYTGASGLNPDGESLEPVLEDREEIDREFVIAEEAHTQRRRMIRTEEEKLIYSLDGETVCRYCDVQHAPAEELYDIVRDPDETENVSGSRLARASELRERAEERAEFYESRRPEGDESGSVEYSDEQRVHDRLTALGYR